jgi:hypothetical protein
MCSPAWELSLSVRFCRVEDKSKEVGVSDFDVRDAQSVKDVEPANSRFKREQVLV